MSSTVTRWKDQSFAIASSNGAAPIHDWFEQTPEVLARLRAALLAGSPLNPQYPVLQAQDLTAKVASLSGYTASDQPLEKLYSQVFSQRRRLLQLAIAAQAGDMAAFRVATENMALQPDIGSFRRILGNLAERAGDRPNRAAEELFGMFPPDYGFKPSLPRAAFVQKLRDPVMALVESLGLPTVIPPAEEVWDAKRIAATLEATVLPPALEDARVKMRVVITAKKPRPIATRKGTMYIPESLMLNGVDAYVLMVRLRLTVERWYRGELTGYYIMLNGTVADLTAGPAILTVVEQVLRSNANFYAEEDAYLACSLAEGIGSEPKSIYEVYAAMVAYYRFVDTQLPTGAAIPRSIEDRAWSMTWKTFAGTDCKTPGVYAGFGTRALRATVSLWDALMREPRIVECFHLGRFDPGFATEVNLLVEAGAIPALR